MRCHYVLLRDLTPTHSQHRVNASLKPGRRCNGLLPCNDVNINVKDSEPACPADPNALTPSPLY